MNPVPARPDPRLALSAAVVSLALAWTAIAASGAVLPTPGADAVGRPLSWVEEVGPDVATFAVLRLGAAAVLAWVTVTLGIGTAARALRLARTVRVVDRVSSPRVRRLAELTSGACMVLVSLGPGVAGAADVGPTSSTTTTALTMHDLGPVPEGQPDVEPPPTAATAPSSTTTTATTSTTAPPEPTPRPTTPGAARGGDPGPASPAPSSAPPPPGHSPLGHSTSDAAPDIGPVWIVAPGDTLWHVAEVTVQQRLGRPALAAEILDRLDELIAANAERLVVPGNADLVFPGQELVLP